ncbi:hypothetical protein E2C01_022808 [Portunus trituberculatus]|uniref:Uncharacterized protein n=1 Tax=Portunus trituberculatus TaxID=210409 RepID=A0A5B7E8L7_PORTR|nr:hypothetical protein [Portunus trituberculatus]
MTQSRNIVSKHSTRAVDLHVDLFRISTRSCGLAEKQRMVKVMVMVVSGCGSGGEGLVEEEEEEEEDDEEGRKKEGEVGG